MRRALVAGVMVTVVLWLPFYALTAGRAGERIDGGPDLRRVDVERVVTAVDGVSSVQVDLVWDPPWDPEMMSEAAKLQLGF